MTLNFSPVIAPTVGDIASMSEVTRAIEGATLEAATQMVGLFERTTAA
jgi:hypothetical protein